MAKMLKDFSGVLGVIWFLSCLPQLISKALEVVGL